MIYLDHNATTPPDPIVLAEMWPYLAEDWGNPSSSYRFGAKLKGAIEKARAEVAELLGAGAREILFTSGATEGNNTAIRAAIEARPDKRHLITSKVEHSAVLSPFAALERQGFRVSYLDVDRNGALDVAALEESLCDNTALVSLMWANNETGVIFPIERIAALCREKGVLFHCDAVQAAGKLSVDLSKTPVDYLSLSGHKMGAPKGIGALYVARKTPFSPLLLGGHQERGRRGGTENVAFIVALGAAARLAKGNLPRYDATTRPLCDALETALSHAIPTAQINGQLAPRLSNTSNISFAGIEAEALLLLLDGEGICASSGSACLADSEDPSHVIAAMHPETTERQTIRFSLGLNNTWEDVDTTVEAVRRAVEMLKG